MTLRAYCDEKGIDYTLRAATGSENARLFLDGDWLTANCETDFDPDAEVVVDNGWLRIADTSGDYGLQLFHHQQHDGQIMPWDEMRG